MDRLRRVARIWNWLPAFRAVAETCHLPTAGQVLGVTPPALSRTVRLLEDDLGVPLFRRERRALVLTDAGRSLLHAVRDAMRRVDDGVALVHDERFAGALVVSATGVVALTWVLPGLRSLCADHPALRVEIVAVPAGHVATELLQGRLDVAFQSAASHHDDLVTTRLGVEPNGLYAGPGHPLTDSVRADRVQVERHPFVTVPPGPRGEPDDGWPEGEPRSIALVVERLPLVVEALATGGYLAVLPDAIARRSRAPLTRLDVADLALARTPVFALHRRTLGDPGPAEAAVDAVRAAWARGDEGGVPEEGALSPSARRRSARARSRPS